MSDQARYHDSERKLRPLPNQTDATYWVIVLVLVVIFAGSLVGGSPVCMAPIVLTMFILPIRAVMAWPDKELARQDLDATERLSQRGDYQRLQAAVDEIAAEIAYKGRIKVVISQNPFEARAFGSWRRHYILLGHEIARQLAWDLQHPEEEDNALALLSHEIGHLHHRDVQHISYTRELLRACFVILPWWGLFLIGWLGFAFLSTDALLAFDISQIEGMDPAVAETISPLLEPLLENKAEIAEKAETISLGLVLNFIINSLWPILFIGFILWLFYWRRMIRLQEFHADRLALAMTGSETALIRAMGRYPKWVSTARPTPTWGKRLRDIRDQWVFTFEEQLYQLSSTTHATWQASRSRLQYWFALHPTFQERLRFLGNPASIQENWVGIGGAIAVLTLSLNVMLISPLASFHTLGNPVFLATIAMFILLSTWLLPHIVGNRPAGTRLAKILALVFGIRAIFVVIDRLAVLLLVVLVPNFASEMLNGFILAIARYSKPIDTLPMLEPFEDMLYSIPIYLVMQLVMPLLTVLLLLLAYYLLQRDAAQTTSEDTAAGNGTAINWHRRHWVLLVTLSIAAITLIMVPFSELLAGDFADLFLPGALALYGLGLGVLVFLLIFHARTRRKAGGNEE